MKISNDQKKLVKDLVRRMREERKRSSQIDKNPVILAQNHPEEFSNIFGLFGPRGAGKSTLLGKVYEDLAKEAPEEARSDSPDDPLPLYVTPPLDCSVIPAEIQVGMATLLHIFPTSKRQSLKSDLANRLEEIIAIYSCLTQEHRDLRFSLASSTGHYGKKLAVDVEARLALRKRLAKWLRDYLDSIRCDALVVPLDDLDLVPRREIVAHWLNAFLDELHQPQLLFVVAADYHRLEHLFEDPERGIDGATAKAQLDKLLPWHRRIDLPPWSREMRLNFPHLDPSSSTATLKTHLAEQVPRTIRKRALLHLLPSWPRGLGNLFRGLESRNSKSTAPSQKSDFQESRDILMLLAQARREPLLARHLRGADLWDWRATLDHPSETLEELDSGTEDWREMVSVAAGRARSAEKWLGTTSTTGGSEEDSGERHDDLSPSFSRLDLLYAPEHEQQTRSGSLDASGGSFNRTLKDASEQETPLWMELLIDLSFNAPDEESGLNRARLLKLWAPLSQRVRKARISLETEANAIRNFALDYEDLGFSSLLYWFSWKAIEDHPSLPEPQRIEIGWLQLLEASSRNREPLAAEQLLDLNLDPRDLRGQIPPPEASQALALIPDQLWAIILLVDALERCPWKAFSARLGWALPTYLLTAGALVHGAYLQAMDAGGLLEGASLREEQKHLLTSIRQSDPTYILSGAPDAEGAYAKEGSYEENVFERLAQILASDLPTGDDPLGRAAEAFEKLAPYQALRDLAAEGLLL